MSYSSVEFKKLVMRGLDPKYNYQLHQIFLNPVGTIMLFMYWIPLAQNTNVTVLPL